MNGTTPTAFPCLQALNRTGGQGVMSRDLMTLCMSDVVTRANKRRKIRVRRVCVCSFVPAASGWRMHA